MKNILLTTTALVAFAGAAAADGHTSFTWGGAATAGVARDAGGEFDTYSEANLTATGSVDLGMATVSGAVSVDAGTGYDFADDDGFDAAKTNGVAFDYIKVDGGAMGALTFDKNDIAHLVDGDDDVNGDIKYTNAFGNANVAFVMDVLKDTDATPSATVAADVQWSTKIGYVISDSASVYAAFDEEKGNAFGGSYSMNGMTVSVDSKLEALEAALKTDRSNTIAGSYTVAGFTAGASYNTIVDGNQWGINAGYSADGMSIAFDTDEASQWTATASYAFNDAASVEAGVNYTEDAYVGVSFKF